jgi:uncharacterized protein
VKLHLAQTPGQNRVSGYGAGYIAINGVRHEVHLLLTAERVLGWEIDRFESLSADHFRHVLALDPEIVILGTGAVQRFPRPEQVRILTAAGVGLEVMDSKAACRTYNILMAEGRKVVAAILVA